MLVVDGRDNRFWPQGVEKGISVSQVRDLRGHASSVTTERYDAQRREVLDQAARKLETGVII